MSFRDKTLSTLEFDKIRVRLTEIAATDGALKYHSPFYRTMFSFLFALASFGREASNADVAQWKEAADLGSAQYGFESLRQYQRVPVSLYQPAAEMSIVKDLDFYIEGDLLPILWLVKFK